MIGKFVNRVARAMLRAAESGGSNQLRREFGVTGPHGRPNAPWSCGVLRSHAEVDNALAQLTKLALPTIDRATKNWDALAALDLILRNTNTNARVFDAGGEWYSTIMPWLGLYGYRNLTVGNLVFSKERRRGPIVYEYSDITKTKFGDSSIDAVACLSVIEHGVDVTAYFKEMSRIIRRGGLLITSVDYSDTPIDTRGQMAFGVPIYIFTREDVLDAIRIAGEFGFSLVAPFDPTMGDQVVHWKEYDLRYTFAMFSFRKTALTSPLLH